MRVLKSLAASAVFSIFLSACAGAPVSLGSATSVPLPDGPIREISSKACGFQLLLFIPIRINGRLERAYEGLQADAARDVITDVKIKESWAYGLIGTSYCTQLKAVAIARKP